MRSDMQRVRSYSDDDSEEEEEEEEERRGNERKSARKGYEQPNDRKSSYEKVEGHQIFKHAKVASHVLQKDILEGSRTRISTNLIAHDTHGRLYVWDSEEKLLRFVEVQRSDFLHSFGDDSGTILATKDSKTVQLSSPVDFQVLHLAFNRTGRSLVLVGDGSLMVVNLLAPSSTSSSGVCRVQKVGADRIFSRGNGQWLRILQVAWHPYSDSHLGVLSSDGCFRLFDLSLNAESAEQEYHLQPSSTKNPGFSSLVRAISFSFGGEHLWDRFTVFVLYNDGSLYALCPIVPFGGMFNAAAVEELAKYAGQLGSMDSPGSTKSESSSLAAAWLEAVFPGLNSLGHPLPGESLGGSIVLKAHAYVPIHASLLLQGPFATLCRKTEGDDGNGYLEQTDCEPCHAVGLLYNVVGKDSILAISTQDGQVQLYVLADEIEPNWSVGKLPRILADDKGHILAVGMLVEASKNANSLDLHPEELRGVCQGQLPPLLRLAFVDLALQPAVLEAGPVVLFSDPVVPERLYCQHPAGIDAILLQWLPFSIQSANKPCNGAPPPAVFPLLDICPTGLTVPRPLLGAVLILDSLGESWIVAVTANCECAVVNMKPQITLPEPLVLGENLLEEQDRGTVELGVFQMMSKELLLGPKDIPITQLTSMGAPLTVDSIEGRALLHDQCKLLHEKYIEYAHRVYVELTSHRSRLYEIVHEQTRQLKSAESKLRQAQKESAFLTSRLQQIMSKNRDLEQRVKRCCTLPGVSEKPLTATEQELKRQLDTMRFQDLDIYNTAVETLSVRAERLLSTQNALAKMPSPGQRKSDRGRIPDSQMRRLKLAVDHLSHLVEDSTLKVKVIDDSVSHRELLKDR
ncbi:nuclear pore complex protein Nup88 [Marchantia polymorpha subsp. ruderalis]|nr:hypothetical protein MARPO_0043s0044 [Marchantia polymorpha]BBM97550.1 hypothetical protein Mp_1g06510 [Marchantia polymorpha subsp. ruderalis]|eukprot:PTQ39792.1 hypothetical protein MARPO_0043s0044 [Marchantia polymorpha]